MAMLERVLGYESVICQLLYSQTQTSRRRLDTANNPWY